MEPDAQKPLPPGQTKTEDFLRFGLPTFAKKINGDLKAINFEVNGAVKTPIVVSGQLTQLQTITQLSDFHCVTTWSVTDQQWQGVKFKDFYDHLVIPQVQPQKKADFVVFEAVDGYRVSMQLEDLLNDDVLLAVTLNGEALGLNHGGPIRLIAPAHYGYKSIKHIRSISFLTDSKGYSFPFPYPAFMEHPRARVAYEERGRIANWILLPVYRLLIKPMRYLFSRFD